MEVTQKLVEDLLGYITNMVFAMAKPVCFVVWLKRVWKGWIVDEQERHMD